MTANPWRGEARLEVAGASYVLRPSFGALVAAEDEVGPLFDLVERAATGSLRFGEMVALFWHCIEDRPAELTRDAFGEAVAAAGLSSATSALKPVLGQILQGR